jgi:tRNA (mo5U34)-methyltransferase
MPAVHDLQRQADALIWFHTMDLGHGVRTKGVSLPEKTVGRLALPESLAGKTVLDIGAWDGYFSFEAERRGAERVVAADWYCWGHGGPYTKDAFLLARRALDSKVEDVEIDPHDITEARLGQFDIVLFLGVLYHLRDPLFVLDRVAEVTSDRLILETAVDLAWVRRPALAFYPDRELNSDATNWFGPNPAAVLAMIRGAGFRRADSIWLDGMGPRVREAARAARRSFDARKWDHPFRPLQQARFVAHGVR